MILNYFLSQFVTIFYWTIAALSLIILAYRRETAKKPNQLNTGENLMSKYTPQMEARLREKEVWTYADCAAFAEQFPEISARSVISKIKNMGLTYEAKPAETKSSTPQVHKADMVKGIAAALNVSYDSIAGLAKADKRALDSLVQALKNG